MPPRRSKRAPEPDTSLDEAFSKALAAWRVGRQPSLVVLAQLRDAGYDIDAIAKRQMPAKPPQEQEPVTNTQAAPALIVKDGAIYANSRDVAAHFKDDRGSPKRHDHVLRDIDNLLRASSDLRGLMFQEVRAFDPAANRVVRSFDMNRDGFSLLVMGYTGPKALQFKLAFLDQFNAMERTLREAAPVVALSQPAPGMEQLVGAMTALVQTMQGFVQAVAPKAPEPAPPAAPKVIAEKPRQRAAETVEAVEVPGPTRTYEAVRYETSRGRPPRRDIRVMLRALGLGPSFRGNYRAPNPDCAYRPTS